MKTTTNKAPKSTTFRRGLDRVTFTRLGRNLVKMTNNMGEACAMNNATARTRCVRLGAPGSGWTMD